MLSSAGRAQAFFLMGALQPYSERREDYSNLTMLPRGMLRLGAAGDPPTWTDPWTPPSQVDPQFGGTPIFPSLPDIPPSSPNPPPAVGSPGPVAFRPGNWDQTTDPPEYVVAQGDTPVGIAALYLPGGAYPGARWTEIRDINVNGDWQLGPNGHYLNHYDSNWADPNWQEWQAVHGGHSWQAGVSLLMPVEALERAKAMAADPSVPKAPSSPGAPGTKPGKLKPPPLTDPKTPGGVTSSTGARALLVGGAALVGGLLYRVVTG